MVTTFAPSSGSFRTKVTISTAGLSGRTYFSVIPKGKATDVVTIMDTGGSLRMNTPVFIDVHSNRTSVTLLSTGDLTGTIITNSIETTRGVPIVVTVGNDPTQVRTTGREVHFKYPVSITHFSLTQTI